MAKPRFIKQGEGQVQDLARLLNNLNGNENPILTGVLDEIAKEPLPSTYIVGRDVSLELAKPQAERDLFTTLEEQESGNFIVYDTEEDFSSIDFILFRRGISKIIYNNSHQRGNVSIGEGKGKRFILSGLIRAKSETYSEKSKTESYSPVIAFSLNDLCREGAGEVTPQNRMAMMAIIKALRSKDYKIGFPNGDELYLPLLIQRARYKRERDGATFYILELNPIWASTAKGWSRLPKDYPQRVAALPGKRTEGRERLFDFLTRCYRRKPLIRGIHSLLEETNLTKAYNKNPQREEEKLLSYIEDAKTIGIIESYKVEKSKVKRRKAVSKVTFYFNPNFIENGTSEEQ